MDEEQEENLKGLGVKDSKLLTPEKREEMFPKIKKIVHSYEIISISAEEIDNRGLANLNLNQLEALKSALIINNLRPDKAILDCPSNNPKDYVLQVRKYLSPEMEKVKIVAEHKADVKYVSVGAASILAKVTRDTEIEELKKKFGENFGSGYPSDPNTIAFLKKHAKELDNFPGLFRHTWDTLKQLKIQKEQKTLFSFKESKTGLVSSSEKESGSATFAGVTPRDLKKLEQLGFEEIEITSEHEVKRMSGPYSLPCTLVLYKSGKLLLQGTKSQVDDARKMIESALEKQAM